MDVSEILDIVDLHGFEDIEEADKVSVLNDTLQDVCTREPWPFLITFADLDGDDIDANGKVTVPADFGSVITLIDTATSGRDIRWIRTDEHQKTRSGDLNRAGNPYNYYFLGNDLYVWPIPGSGTYRLTYVRVHDELTAADVEAAILLPKRHHRLLAVGTIWRLHAQEDDAENATMFKSQYDEKLMIMKQDLFKQQWESPDSVLVFDWDGPYSYGDD